METKDFIFEPSQELLEFADSFSESWYSAVNGDYYSRNNNYHIEVYDDIFDKNGAKLNIPSRVGEKTGTIQISKNNLKGNEATNNYVFFLILWSVIEYNLKSHIKSDIFAIEYYCKTGRPMKDIITMYMKVFNQYNYPSNKERMAKIMKSIETYQKQNNIRKIL